MNLATPLGLLLATLIIGFVTTSGIDNSRVFMDAHAAALVLGGTVSVALMMFPVRHLYNLIKVYLRVLSGKNREEVFATIAEIMQLATQIEARQPLSDLVEGVQNPFLKEGVGLVAMGEGSISEKEIIEILEKRLQNRNEKYKRDSAHFKALGKFPPAFGLMGATLGMIALLQGLGKPGAFESLGPAMSVALVATFMGLVVANVIIIPIGENLVTASQNDLRMRRIVVDGVLLLRRKIAPLIVEQHLISYLEPSERDQLAKA